MDDLIRLVILTNGLTLISKIEEVQEFEIGEPNCILADPMVVDMSVDYEKGLSRYPDPKLTQETKMMILSDNILTMVVPNPKLLSEYLVQLSD